MDAAPITVIVLLGGTLPWYLGDGEVYDPTICGGRVAEAFRVFQAHYQADSPSSTYLLAKQYPTTRQVFRSHFQSIVGPDPLLDNVLLTGGHADVFLNNGFDTIEETVMSRYALEMLFPNQKINLIVITSDFHAKRTNFLFSSVYSSTTQFVAGGTNNQFVCSSTTTNATREREAAWEEKGIREIGIKFGDDWSTWYMNTIINSNLVGVQALIKFFGPTIALRPCDVSTPTTPLHVACTWGWTLEEIQLLKQQVINGKQENRIKEKCKIIAKEQIFTRHTSYMALLRVANVGFMNIHLQICKELIQAGAKVDQPNQEGATPLHYAIAQQLTDVVVYLVRECGARVDVPATGKYWQGTKTQKQLIQENPIMEMLLQDVIIN